MLKIDGWVSDCKNKMIKTKKSVPCSQSKIVHSRKLNLEKKQKGDSDGFITSKIKEELGEGTGKHVQQFKSSCMDRVVAKEMSVTLPAARNFFTTKHSDVVLQVSSKRPRAVRCILGIANAKFTAGWKEFVLENNLKVGDVCVFERVSRSKLLFNFIIFPSPEGEGNNVIILPKQKLLGSLIL
ncbi:uncharacterized protein LOC132047575 [Lycium ferocissimum]|uniref:uncharacterized protein LOC132047575 n=1 Tax=Lycium ferocissimum TaxID=112874 RepID=UPI002816488C|nr:uncharacterized protein LOC132047575 [Lycium ferocissimum]